MTLRPFLAVAGAALALAAAPQARAATYDLIFTGNVASGVDVLNLFGGAVKAGDAMSVTYRYDTDLGVRTSLANVYDEIDSDYPSAPAITQATLRIDGHSYTYTPDVQASVSIGAANFDWTDGAYDIDGASASGQSLDGDNSATVFQIGGGQALPTDLSGSTYFTGFGLGYFDTAFSGPDNLSDNFYFSASSVAVSAAPEPTVWSLLILAVGACGAALRGRRRRAAAFAT